MVELRDIQEQVEEHPRPVTGRLIRLPSNEGNEFSVSEEESKADAKMKLCDVCYNEYDETTFFGLNC